MKQISRTWLIIGIGLAILSLGISWWLLVHSPVRFGAVAIADSSGIWRLIYGYLITLLGVVFGTAYRNLHARRAKGESDINGVIPLFKSIFLSIDFWLGISGSPLVYALIVQATHGGSMAGLTIMALQNGFFCTLVISGLKPASGEIMQTESTQTAK